MKELDEELAAGSSGTGQQKKRIQKRVVVFWVFAVLLLLHILTSGLMHQAASPFNSLSGKIAFIGIFVGGPVYVFSRISKPIGSVFLGLSVFLWTLGFSILIEFIEVIAGS